MDEKVALNQVFIIKLKKFKMKGIRVYRPVTDKNIVMPPGTAIVHMDGSLMIVSMRKVSPYGLSQLRSLLPAGKYAALIKNK